MPMFHRDGICFFYTDLGDPTTIPFVFQHGLGATSSQPVTLLSPPPPSVRLISLDCRGHGRTPLGNPEKLNFDTFADDIVALLDTLGIQQAVVGGISMGAGIALTMAIRYPQRVAALVLFRPAWLAGPMVAAKTYQLIAALIRCYGLDQGRTYFLETQSYQNIVMESPDAANSLLGQFTEQRALESIERLEYIPQDQPIATLEALRSISVPTLILATQLDPVHPVEYARTMAKRMRNAVYQEITPKSIHKVQHAFEARMEIEEFLRSFAALFVPQCSSADTRDKGDVVMDATLLRTSFDLLDPNTLAALFYQRLFEAYPETRALFKQADISAQAHKLAATLAVVVTSVEKGENIIPALRALGERHTTYGVLPEHYPLVGKMLLEALRDTLGSQWTSAYQEAWSQAIEAIAHIMSDTSITV